MICFLNFKLHIIETLNSQTQIPIQLQQLLYNGREMRNAEKLGALGVGDGDLVMMVSKASSSRSRFPLISRNHDL